MRYSLYDVLEDIMYTGSKEDITKELIRIQREDLKWDDDTDKMADAIYLFNEGEDTPNAILLLEDLFLHLSVESHHSHEKCMSVEIPAIYQDAILFWKCDDGKLRNAWTEDSPMYQKAEEAMKGWAECSICHGMIANHKLSCPNNPNAPVKIPVEFYPLEDLI